jgi:glycosyltransferase involved in cell wall biosynthesis
MTGKKKLLVLSSTFPRWKNDPLPPFVYELSRRLTDKFDVTVLAPSFPGAKDFEVMDKMKVHRFHYFLRPLERLAGSGGILPTLKKNPLYYLVVPFFLFGEYFALKKLAKELKPNLIHAHWVIPNGITAFLVNKNIEIPYVVTSHGSDIMGIKGMGLIQKMILNNAKHITVVSTALKQEILKKAGSDITVDVIPMGVDRNLFKPSAKDLSIRKKYGIHDLFLLYVGRFAYEKGVDRLIQLMPGILKERPEAKLMLIGSGKMETELKKNAIKLGIEDNIIFIGPVRNDDLPKYYATADIFIGLSRREGFGLSFVEAGMCGCWLIGTKVGGIPDIIIDKSNGSLIKTKKLDFIEGSIISNILKCNKYDKRKQSLYFKKFDWKNIAAKYKDVLN